jgi:hypothetical protein
MSKYICNLSKYICNLYEIYFYFSNSLWTDQMGRAAGRTGQANWTATQIMSVLRLKRMETGHLGRYFGSARWKCPTGEATNIYMRGIFSTSKNSK